MGAVGHKALLQLPLDPGALQDGVRDSSCFHVIWLVSAGDKAAGGCYRFASRYVFSQMNLVSLLARHPCMPLLAKGLPGEGEGLGGSSLAVFSVNIQHRARFWCCTSLSL